MVKYIDTVGKLADLMVQYYTRKGSRIVFRNGMTLNQLALAMWEREGGESVDASVISRVVSGERLFTSRQVKIFSKVVKLSKNESQELGEALAVDWRNKLGLIHECYMPKVVSVEAIEYTLTKLEEDRYLLSIQKLWDINSELEAQIALMLKVAKDQNMREKLKELYARVLINVALYRSSTIPTWDRSVYHTITRHEKILKDIGKKTNNSNIHEMGKAIKHAYYYYNKKYPELLKYLKTINIDQLKDPVWRIDAEHGLLVSLGYNHNENDLIYMTKRFLANPRLDSDEKAKLYKGCAEGAFASGNTQIAYSMLEKAWKYHELTDKSNRLYKIRKTQLINTQLFFDRKNGIKLSNKLIKTGLGLANEIGHKVYQNYLYDHMKYAEGNG